MADLETKTETHFVTLGLRVGHTEDFVSFYVGNENLHGRFCSVTAQLNEGRFYDPIRASEGFRDVSGLDIRIEPYGALLPNYYLVTATARSASKNPDRVDDTRGKQLPAFLRITGENKLSAIQNLANAIHNYLNVEQPPSATYNHQKYNNCTILKRSWSREPLLTGWARTMWNGLQSEDILKFMAAYNAATNEKRGTKDVCVV